MPMRTGQLGGMVMASDKEHSNDVERPRPADPAEAPVTTAVSTSAWLEVHTEVVGADRRKMSATGPPTGVPVDDELHADPLPTYLTRFVGRQRELAELSAWSGSRLVTICGMGGLGKTRLAIEHAKRLRTAGRRGLDRHAVYWVSLGPVTEAAQVPAEVAGAIGLTSPSGAPALLAVVNALRDRSALLVLDNCEHVSTACVEVITTLLERCPAVSILTTSRIALGVPAEQVYTVPPMGAESVDLFVDRARSVAPAYALTDNNADPIAEICSRLDGLPLAIELAASWVRALSPRDLLSGLEPTLATRATTGVVEDRHRSLTAVLDSSWQWLSDTDRAVVTALGVFRGGFTRDAAEYVAQASLASLATLTERALIQRLPDAVGGTRYQFHELVRAYAVDRLEASGEATSEAVRTRHFDYFLRLAERRDNPDYTLIDPRRDLPVARERADLEAALAWAVDRGDAPGALRLLAALDRFWIYSLHRDEDQAKLISRALALPWPDQQPDADRARADALRFLGHAVVDVDPDTGRAWFRASYELSRRVGDAARTSACLGALGWADYVAGDWPGSTRHLQAACDHARAGGDVHNEAWATLGLGLSSAMAGDLVAARAGLTRALSLFEDLQELAGKYRGHLWLSEALRRHRLTLESIEHLRLALELQRTHAFTVDGADLLDGAALIAGSLHRWEAAGRLNGAAVTWRTSHGEVPHLHHRNLAQHRRQGRRQLGDRAWQEAYTAGERLTDQAAEELAEVVLAELAESLAPRPAGLTERELEVLRLVAEGLSNPAIADRLVLSPRTVHAHLRSIFDKLGVSTRTAAAHEAVRLHLT